MKACKLSNPREIETAENKAPTALYAFDVVHTDGYDLPRCRLVDRKTLLFDRLQQSNYIKAVSTFDDGIALFNACKEQQLEGIVAKKQTSFYRSGERSKDWIKIKFTQTEQFVVVGHRKDEGFLVAQNAAQGLHGAESQTPNHLEERKEQCTKVLERLEQVKQKSLANSPI